MKIIKKISLFLVVLLIFISASCSNANDSNTDKTTPDTPDNNVQDNQNAPPEEQIEDKAERFTPNLPDADFEGYVFRAYVFDYGTLSLTFNVEEENSDIINDAIYKRNRYVEEKYNVVLKQIKTQDDP